MRDRDYVGWLLNFGVIGVSLFLGLLVLGASFGIFWGAKINTFSNKAKSECSYLSNTIRQFWLEYGHYPVPPAYLTVADVFAGADDLNAVICNILTNNTQAGDYVAEVNPRGIIFLEAPKAKAIGPEFKDGMASNGRFYDPWGREYRILIDTNGDGRIANPYQAHAGAESISAPAIAWSLGTDRSGATNRAGAGDRRRGTNRDDVISWQ